MIKAVLITFGSPPNSVQGMDNYIQINGGISTVDGVLSEARDFLPNYSSLNSALFESSVILTSWRHMDQIFGNSMAAFLHDDITPTQHFDECMKIIESGPRAGASYGIAVPDGIFPSSADYTSSDYFRCSNDPWWSMSFDLTTNIWSALGEYDEESYEYIKTVDIPMIYGHQFICTQDVFTRLGSALSNILDRVKLNNVGLWTPHVFERIIAIRLHMYSYSAHRLLNMYQHNLSSGRGKNKLYGVREYKFISSPST